MEKVLPASFVRLPWNCSVCVCVCVHACVHVCMCECVRRERERELKLLKFFNESAHSQEDTNMHMYT